LFAASHQSNAAIINDYAVNFDKTFSPDQAQNRFSVIHWIKRGSCCRQRAEGDCYATLNKKIEHVELAFEY
jgi:hypothetical protein